MTAIVQEYKRFYFTFFDFSLFSQHIGLFKKFPSRHTKPKTNANIDCRFDFLERSNQSPINYFKIDSIAMMS